MTGSGTDANAVLNGFTIVGGNADGIPPHNTGGGLFNEGGSPIVANCIFVGNEATKGGGIHNLNDGNASIFNCMFRVNTALGGGAILNSDSSPTIANCIFSGNTACTGGGVVNLDSSEILTSTPDIVNCTFVGNTATVAAEGGGMWSLGSNPTVANCIFWSNTGGEIIDLGDAATTVTYSDVEGGWTGEGNIDADPLFVDADGLDDVIGTDDDDLHLQSGSLCIDAGDNTVVPADDADVDGDGDTSESLPDLDGNPRFIDDPGTDDTGNGTAPIVDMGPYELCPGVEPPTNPSGEEGYTKNRYLSFVPGNPGVLTAQRVMFVDMPEPFESWEGETVWVGEPEEVCENSGQRDPPPGGCGAAWPGGPALTLMVAECVCEPYYANWPTIVGNDVALHVYGQEIVPGATYEIQAIHEGCDVGIEGNYSDALVITTSRWGDICGIWDGSHWTAPDGEINTTLDVTACLEKFKNTEGAPIKARCDVDPETPQQKVDLSTDVTRILDAFRGQPYPFPMPTPCP